MPRLGSSNFDTRQTFQVGVTKCSKKQSFTAVKRAWNPPWFRIGYKWPSVKCQALIRSTWFDKFQKKQKIWCKGCDKRPWTCSAIVCHLVWQTTTWIFWEKLCVDRLFRKSTYPKSLQQIGWAHLCFGNEPTKPHSEQKQTSEVKTYCSWFSSAGVQSGALIDTICPLLHSS